MEKIKELLKKSSVRYALIILLWVTVIVSIIGVKYSNVYKECYVEAGVEVKLEDFFVRAEKGVSFAANSDTIQINVPGTYHIVMEKGNWRYTSTLHITDTIAPQGDSVNVTLGKGEECEADAFVSDIVDVTKVEVLYKERPDFNKLGEQKVEVVLKDLGGNETVVSSELYISPVISDLYVEAGSVAPTADAFLLEAGEAELLTDIETLDYTVLTQKEVSVKVDGSVYRSKLHIVDTIFPEVQVRDVQGYLLAEYEASDFIVSIEDATEVTTKINGKPDKNKSGEQELEIYVTDAGGNEVIKKVKLTLEKDEEPPIIEGVRDIKAFIGDVVSYKKGVEVIDNCMKGLELSVDNSAVNLQKAGTYPVHYVARDLAGNETKMSATVTVKARTYSEEDMYMLADDVLARIIKDGMTLYQKAEAIYKYIKSHVSYVSSSEKGDWVKAAYEGLADRKGDCYVYACTAKALLTRAGITNMDIEKIPAKSRHYWNLVDIGEGWYHFDTTPRKGGGEFLMCTEAQLMSYSTTHDNSHNYDHSLYPTVN